MVLFKIRKGDEGHEKNDENRSGAVVYGCFVTGWSADTKGEGRYDQYYPGWRL